MRNDQLVKWLVLTCAVIITSYILDGIHVSGVISAFLASALLAFFNAILRPVLLILTLPINILSLGLFTFIINAFLLRLVSLIIPGFYVEGFLTAVLGSLLISMVSFIINSFFGDGRKGNMRIRYIRRK